MAKEIEIRVNTGSSVDTTKDLRKEITQLKKELFSLEEGTEQYNQTFQELSNKMLEFKDRNEALRMSAQDLGQQIGNVINITKGMAAGFEVVQGTMTLFGGESEQLEKIMVKLQAAISIVQGLEGLEGLTKSIPALVASFGKMSGAVAGFTSKLSIMKKALIGTGIGAIAVALGAIIMNWDKIESLWNKTKVLDELKSDLDGLNNTFKTNENQLKTNQEAAYSQYRQAIIASKGDVDEMTAAEKRLQEALKGTSREILQANLAAAWAAEDKAYREYVDAATGLFVSKERKKELADAFTEIKNARIKAQEELKKYDEEAAVKEIETIRENNQKKIDAYAEYITNLDAKLKSLGLRGIGDDVFIHPKEKYDEAVATLKEALDKKLITEEQHLMALQQLKAKYGDNGDGVFGPVLSDEMRENADKGMTEYWDNIQKENLKGQSKVLKTIDTGNKQQTKNTEQMWQNSVDITAASLGAMNQLAQAANIESKPLQIAMALMNTYQAANSVMAQQFGGVGAKIAAMITVIGAGLANVVSIMSVNPAGENGAGVGAAAMPNVPTANMLPTDVLGTTLTSNNEVDLQAENAKNTRVYVLESDIQNSMNNVKTTVSEATF